jgi:hypothetical protein
MSKSLATYSLASSRVLILAFLVVFKGRVVNRRRNNHVMMFRGCIAADRSVRFCTLLPFS